MHRLQVPLDFAGHRVHRDRRVAKQIRARSVSAVAIVAGAADRLSSVPVCASTVNVLQTLMPERFLHPAPSQVSWPATPRCGTVWNAQTSFPVAASQARTSPRPPREPSSCKYDPVNTMFFANSRGAVQSTGAFANSSAFTPGFKSSSPFSCKARHQLASPGVDRDQKPSSVPKKWSVARRDCPATKRGPARYGGRAGDRWSRSFCPFPARPQPGFARE
jgi:hypothetical protein